MLVDLTILSYHKFTEEPDEYPFSRTYEQFAHDLNKKIFDWITIDDGMKCMVRACTILRDHNIKAKLFICTSLIGEPGYCDWDELRYLARFHDIENHATNHRNITELSPYYQKQEISKASKMIEKEIDCRPRYFVPPYNTFDLLTEDICNDLGLTLLKDRITIKNTSK